MAWDYLAMLCYDIKWKNIRDNSDKLNKNTESLLDRQVSSFSAFGDKILWMLLYCTIADCNLLETSMVWWGIILKSQLSFLHIFEKYFPQTIRKCVGNVSKSLLTLFPFFPHAKGLDAAEVSGAPARQPSDHSGRHRHAPTIYPTPLYSYVGNHFF